jgi:hypothetical protein
MFFGILINLSGILKSSEFDSPCHQPHAHMHGSQYFRLVVRLWCFPAELTSHHCHTQHRMPRKHGSNHISRLPALYSTQGSDMSQGCSRSYKPKTGPKRTQKEYIPKQRKYNYFTSLKLWSQKFKNRFYKKNPSYHKEYLTSKYSTLQLVFFYKIT